MFSNTHAFIADKVYNHLKENNSIIIDRLFFKYGSIKPDFSPKLSSIGHYKKDSLYFVLNEIKTLSNQPFPQDKNLLKYYSIRLGVIIHFLSDYFCIAHNNIKYRNDKLKHFAYEAKLESLIGKFENTLIEHINKSVPMIFSESTGDYLINKLNSYKQSDISYFNDLEYAVTVSLTICIMIINTSLHAAKTIVA